MSPHHPNPMTFEELNHAWELACRAYAATDQHGPAGPYRPLGSRSRKLLNALWSARALDKGLPDLGAKIVAGEEVRVFGDPHFGHANIIAFCSRPFDGPEAMDQALWTSIEAAASKADACVCLGDWAMKGALDWHRRWAGEFPGKAFTLAGNHDAKVGKPAQWADAGALASLAFELPMELCIAWAKRSPGQEPEPRWDELPPLLRVGMSHWPIPPKFLPGPEWINLHGHTHDAPSRPLRINASMEAIGFDPAPISSLIGWRVLGELARRQSGLAGFDEEAGEPLPDI